MASEEPDRERRNAYVIGFLVAAVVGLGLGLVVALTGDDDGGSPSTSAATTAPGTETEPPQTETEPQPPATTETSTPEPATLTQEQAKAQARDQASLKARERGIDLVAGDFDAQCTGEGGGSRALTWSCTVTSTDGRCAGEVTVVATGGPRAGRSDTVTCG